MQIKSEIQSNKSFDPSYRKFSNDQMISSTRSNLISNPNSIRIEPQTNKNNSFIPLKPNIRYVTEKNSERSDLSEFRKTSPNPEFSGVAEMKNTYV